MEEQTDQQQPPQLPPTPTFFAVNPSLAPKNFSGMEENADEWLQYFNRYSTFRKFDSAVKYGNLSILLCSTAADWFEALSDAEKRDFALLEAAFKACFTKLDMARWKRADKLLSRVQKSDETVDQYITDVIKLARAVPITDDAFIRCAIIWGLKLEICL